MENLILHPTPTAQWHSLVAEASHASGINLNEDLESYLVFLLMRFEEHVDLAANAIALDYLEIQQQAPAQRCSGLRDLGDQCLLVAGLFPGRAIRRQVKINYFINLGQNAYNNLAEINEKILAKLFAALSDQFIALMDVLHTARDLSNDDPSLAPIQAFDIWGEFPQSQVLEQFIKDGYSLPIRGNKSEH